MIKEMPINLKDLPDNAGHSESNMLPRSFWQNIHLFLNPCAGSFFTTAWAKATFAGEWDAFSMWAIRVRASIEGKTSYIRPTT